MTTRVVARVIASFCGCGFAPFASGTVGAFAALVLGVGLMQLPPWVLPVAIMVAALGGVWAISASDAGNDPGWVVIDEVAGMWITMMALGRPTWTGLAAAFFLFRVLDVLKPGPIGWADRQHNPAGVMADDLIAGVIGAGILWAVQRHWPEVFVT